MHGRRSWTQAALAREAQLSSLRSVLPSSGWGRLGSLRGTRGSQRQQAPVRGTAAPLRRSGPGPPWALRTRLLPWGPAAACSREQSSRRALKAQVQAADPGAGLGAQMPYNWQKYEEWRNHPMLKKSNNLKLRHSLPGLTWAVGAFAVYVAYDQLTSRGSSSHGADGHH